MTKRRGNPRKANGYRRRQAVARLRSLGRPCWVCGLPIDYGLPAGCAESFECDELVPVSLGGSPTDPANVAPAHRCCNNWRGARPARWVDEMRSRVALSFGAIESPLHFVRCAKTLERSPSASRGETPPQTTTSW